ncbi:uncharacterized protein LOC126336507 isoform X2 [Schistocerca gregaria]|uniref:uncharacterized protein LOC126336507 isoform X2 n=1 Tax=Schistocerca gregaria TaxID=7010 RepID=UPI00211F239F|nr:uncharacterized protein LOC126336507 isoform X2 [Schistocerca gregaria]
MAALQQAPEQQQQQPRLHVEVCVELAARAAETRSPGGSRKAAATATTTIEVEECGEAQEEAEAASDPAEAVQNPVAQPRTLNWVIADGRRALLETEPAKSNLARTHTLQGIAERMRERVTAEAHQLLRLQGEVESATGASALDAVRLWLLERGLERRVHHHLSLVFREMHLLREAHHQFDARAVAPSVGSPALHLLHDPSGFSSHISGPGAHALPATGSRPALGARRRGRSGGPSSCSTAAAEDHHHRVSEAEEPSALASSGESAWAAAEVAVAMATAAGDDDHDDDDACRFSPVQWSRDRFDTVRTKGNSDSISNNSDGLLDTARALQDVNAGSREDAAVDKLIQATSSTTAVTEAVEAAEACAAMAVFRELQRQFESLADTLRQHALVADGVLRQAGQWKLSGGGVPGAEGEEEQRPPSQQQLLLHEVALMHCETQRTQVLLLRSERALQRIADSLPPAPTMVRLPPSPPLRRRRLGLDWFSTILKRRFLRRQ